MGEHQSCDRSSDQQTPSTLSTIAQHDHHFTWRERERALESNNREQDGEKPICFQLMKMLGGFLSLIISVLPDKPFRWCSFHPCMYYIAGSRGDLLFSVMGVAICHLAIWQMKTRRVGSKIDLPMPRPLVYEVNVARTAL